MVNPSKGFHHQEPGMPRKRLTFVTVAEISLSPAEGRYTYTLGGLTIENDEPISEEHIFQIRVGSTTLSQSSWFHSLKVRCHHVFSTSFGAVMLFFENSSSKKKNRKNMCGNNMK